MRLPWKKSKGCSYSCLVAGLRHTPIHGESLVVETGFPTSLVDLFVKNKDRLKKLSKRKSARPPPPPPPSPARRLVSPGGLAVNSPPGFEATKRNVEDLVVLNECDECDDSGDSDGKIEKGFLAVVLKILMVGVVALSTKEIAVGITMSAFLLFLVEYAGSGALVFLKPCSKIREVLDSLFVKIKVLYFPNSICKKEDDDDGPCSNEIKRCNEDSTNAQLIIRSDVSDSCEFVDEIGVKSPGREIQVADSNCDGEKRDVLIFKERSRSAKIRRKFVKNFVPKKLRDAKKEWKHRKREKEKEKEMQDFESNSDEKLENQEQDNMFGYGQAEAEVGKVEEIVDKERKRNSGYFLILLLFVVLGGLLGGRVLALFCTLGWFLMLKLVEKVMLRLEVVM